MLAPTALPSAAASSRFEESATWRWGARPLIGNSATSIATHAAAPPRPSYSTVSPLWNSVQVVAVDHLADESRIERRARPWHGLDG